MNGSQCRLRVHRTTKYKTKTLCRRTPTHWLQCAVFSQSAQTLPRKNKIKRRTHVSLPLRLTQTQEGNKKKAGRHVFNRLVAIINIVLDGGRIRRYWTQLYRKKLRWKVIIRICNGMVKLIAENKIKHDLCWFMYSVYHHSIFNESRNYLAMLLHSSLSNNQTCVGAVLPAAANYSTSLLRIHKPDTLTLSLEPTRNTEPKPFTADNWL